MLIILYALADVEIFGVTGVVSHVNNRAVVLKLANVTMLRRYTFVFRYQQRLKRMCIYTVM